MEPRDSDPSRLRKYCTESHLSCYVLESDASLLRGPPFCSKPGNRRSADPGGARAVWGSELPWI